MNDLISRQAAMDAFYKYPNIHWTTLDVLAKIKALPSAEPVIRCKDCRWGREVCGNIECCVDSNMPEYHGYEWFCPNGERKQDATS